MTFKCREVGGGVRLEVRDEEQCGHDEGTKKDQGEDDDGQRETERRGGDDKG